MSEPTHKTYDVTTVKDMLVNVPKERRKAFLEDFASLLTRGWAAVDYIRKQLGEDVPEQLLEEILKDAVIGESVKWKDDGEDKVTLKIKGDD